MSHKTDDQQWLNVLSGQSVGKDAMSATDIEATLLRNTLILKGKAQEVFEPNKDGFQRLMVEARRQGLLHVKRSEEPALRRLFNFLAAPAGVLAFPATALTSVLLILGVGIVIGWQIKNMRTSGAPQTTDTIAIRPTESTVAQNEPVNRIPPAVASKNNKPAVIAKSQIRDHAIQDGNTSLATAPATLIAGLTMAEMPTTSETVWLTRGSHHGDASNASLSSANLPTNAVAIPINDKNSNDGNLISSITTIMITTKDPEQYALSLISVAMEAALEAISQKSDEHISVTLNQFKPNSEKQAKVRELLKLKSDISGSVHVIISANK